MWASSRYHRSIAKACVPESMPWFTNEGQEMKFQFFKKRLRSKFKFRFPRNRRRPRPCHGPKGHLKRRTAVVGVLCAWRGRRGRPRPPDSKLKPTHGLEEVNRRVSNVHLYVNVCGLSFFKSTFSGLSYLLSYPSYLWSWQLCCPLNGSFVSAALLPALYKRVVDCSS